MTETVGFRTTLKPGQAAAYQRIHSRIPDAVASALRSAGVVSWRIWIDGLLLFHQLETVWGADEMGRRMDAVGPIDPEWDALIATLVSSDPGSSQDLPLVWGMDESSQFAGIDEPGVDS